MKVNWATTVLLLLCQTVVAADAWLHITHEETPELPGNEIQFVKPTEDGQGYWIGTLTGAARLENGTFEPIAQTEGVQVWDIVEMTDERLWIGYQNGLMEIQGDTLNRSLQGHTVAAIHRVGGDTWIIAKNRQTDRNHLMLQEEEQWAPPSAMEGRYLEDIERDVGGRYWLMLDGDGVLEVDVEAGLGEAHHHLQGVNVTSVMTDSRGRVWCGLWGGGIMMREEEGGWTRHLARERAAVLSLVEDDNRKIWAATSGNGLWVYDGDNWQPMLQDEGAISLMRRTDDGRIWISTQSRGGLRYWNGQEWIVSLDTFLPIRTLVEGPDGNLIAGGVLDGIYILER